MQHPSTSNLAPLGLCAACALLLALGSCRPGLSAAAGRAAALAAAYGEATTFTAPLALASEVRR